MDHEDELSPFSADIATSPEVSESTHTHTHSMYNTSDSSTDHYNRTSCEYLGKQDMTSICLDSYDEDQVNTLIDKTQPLSSNLHITTDLGHESPDHSNVNRAGNDTSSTGGHGQKRKGGGYTPISEREVTLKHFELELKIKRSVMTLCYLLLFVVELIYYQYFTFWSLCPLLLAISWFCLLTLNRNLSGYFGKKRKHSLRRVLMIASLSALNLSTVISLIVIYSSSFLSMHHFNHHADYSFKLVMTFDILFAFCSLCIDIDILDYSTYTVMAHKLIFLGIFHHEKFKIEEVHGQWITKQYTFAHPSSLTPSTVDVAADGTESDHIQRERDLNYFGAKTKGKSLMSLKSMKNRPIGIWQRLILLLFVIGMFGSSVFTIYGIQQMQPFIED